jgi:hypothetical protein
MQYALLAKFKQQYDRTIFRFHEALAALPFYFSVTPIPLFRKNKLCRLQPPDHTPKA